MSDLFEIPQTESMEAMPPVTAPVPMASDTATIAGAGAVLAGSSKPNAPPSPAPFKDDERPCDRGETCARFTGEDCPGGRGC